MMITTLRGSDVIPETGWIRRYVQAASRLTDAAMVFHVGFGLAMLSAAAAPYVHAIIKVGPDILDEPLHLWCLGIGPSGNHKGTACRRAYEMAKDTLGSRYRSPTGSRQGMEDMLAKQTRPILIMEEAPDWFSANRAAAMRGGSAFWCNLYDGLFWPRSLAGDLDDKSRAVRIDVVMIAAGSTDGMLAYTKPIDWRGGLLSRMFILNAGDPAKPRPLGFSWMPEVASELAKRMIECVHSVSPCKDGERTVIEADRFSVEMYCSWSADLAKQIRGLPETKRRLGVRLGNHVLRAAALYAISRRSASISAADMLAATRLGRHSLDSIRSLPVA